MTSIFSDLAAQIEATADVDVADAQSDITKFAEFVMMDQSGRPHQLQWFHKDMLKAMVENKRVVIEAFRGSGKSRSAITFVLWLLMKNRDLRIMIVTESDSLAKEWLQEIEHYMETENYIRLAGDMIPTRTSGLTWTNERKIVSGRSPAATGYSLLATGIQGQIRGRRVDVILCDDICSENNSHTAYQREVLSNWFHAALLRTLDIRPEEPLSGQVIYLSTPLYDNDLTAELRKQWA